MLIVAVAWIYVVLMMAVAEAIAPNGTVLGAVFTLLLYGVLPLGIVIYLLGTPARRAARRAHEAAVAATASAAQPDGGGQAPGAPVAPEREEP